MSLLMEAPTTLNLKAAPGMAKNPKKSGEAVASGHEAKAHETKQIGLRLAVDTLDRLKGIAAALDTDVSGLIRQMIAENVGTYLSRARAARQKIADAGMDDAGTGD